MNRYDNTQGNPTTKPAVQPMIENGLLDRSPNHIPTQQMATMSRTRFSRIITLRKASQPGSGPEPDESRNWSNRRNTTGSHAPRRG